MCCSREGWQRRHWAWPDLPCCRETRQLWRRHLLRCRFLACQPGTLLQLDREVPVQQQQQMQLRPGLPEQQERSPCQRLLLQALQHPLRGLTQQAS